MPDMDQREFIANILSLLASVRGVRIVDNNLKVQSGSQDESIQAVLISVAGLLHQNGHEAEGQVLGQVREQVDEKKEFGGLGLEEAQKGNSQHYADVLFLVESWLTSLNSEASARNFMSYLSNKQDGTKPMTLSEKIFAQHVVGDIPEGGLTAGNVLRVGLDWVLASELSWKAMEMTYREMGSPGIWRNDRFWLAGDHVVHPDVRDVPKVKAMVDTALNAKEEFKMTEFQGMNYTIMHTEFARSRAEPGMLCIGSDSHTCSAGAVSALAIGLGAADVMMALALGETWFKVPESILIEFVGQPLPGISGKDVILYILKELKRNTVAAERIVEFAGDGAKHLSCDARFAICNMCTEFGAVTGLFVPDEITRSYVRRRRRKLNKESSLYFKPDVDAGYAGKYTIDLSKVEPSIAVYPEPDNVVPVSEMEDMPLNGVFIGACTTTEEEHVLAGLVLKAGLEMKIPMAKGKKHYVPGSLPIVEKLRSLGLLQIYEAAGFTRGPPGCSYCVGLSAEKASAGETWLSSQNRNFKNRMGTGSFGHLSSAVVCAASSFGMKVTNPAPFLERLDLEFFEKYKGGHKSETDPPIKYVEPDLGASRYFKDGKTNADAIKGSSTGTGTKSGQVIRSKIIALGDLIDTDALSPGHTLTDCVTDEEFGAHVLEHTHPDFRASVKSGQQVVVAGHAFGVGSSRETAVSALKGVGVKAVIARSFAFIFGRNLPSLGLLGFTMSDEAFFNAAKDGTDITVDIPTRKIQIDGAGEFGFRISELELRLSMNKGITSSFNQYGKSIWQALTQGASKRDEQPHVAVHPTEEGNVDKNIQW